jgi:cytochrome c oxidase subunit 2
MTPQFFSFWLYLFLAATVVGVFAWVALSTKRPREVSARGAGRLRGGFFVLVTVVLAMALLVTLGKMPYRLWAGEVPDHVIFVTAKQFAFAVSEQPVAAEGDWEELMSRDLVEVPAGALIELRVTALDVNHGVGIYDPAGTLIGQVQSMPGYVSRLRMRLEEPGRYNIFCLELCGTNHHAMRGALRVKTASPLSGRTSS